MHFQRKVLIFVVNMTMFFFCLNCVKNIKNSNYLFLAIITTLTHIFATATLKCLKI